MWKSRLVSLGAALVMAAGASSNVSAQAPQASGESLSGSNYDIEKVMEAAHAPKENLILLTAHRGLWGKVPENTVAAIMAAAEAEFESIEIDVRLSGDGSPWLMHDYNMDRLTTGSGYLSAYRDSTLESDLIKLRDRQGKETDYKLETLDDALDYYASYVDNRSWETPMMRGFVLVIDLKSPQTQDPNFDRVSAFAALKISWERVKKYSDLHDCPLGDGIIFKLKARELPSPAILESYLGLKGDGSDHFHLVPVLHNNSDEGDAVFKQYMEKPYTVGFEAVMEHVGQQPSQGWIETLQGMDRTISGFPGWNEFPEGTVMSSALCCVYRNVDPTVPGLDYSGSFLYQLQIGANWLTADIVVFLDEYLKQLGLRDVDQLK